MMMMMMMRRKLAVKTSLRSRVLGKADDYDDDDETKANRRIDLNYMRVRNGYEDDETKRDDGCCIKNLYNDERLSWKLQHLEREKKKPKN